MLVKDNIAVAGMQWTAGSPGFAHVRAEIDATAVRLLRDKGAVLPVKTTLHELAFGVTGANGWTGAIANPVDTGRASGGSSGGSAAALAIGLGDVSLVTDTGGSARIPAAFCGLIGFRPSMGRYPSDGLIGLSPSRDTIGLMARELRWIEWADTILSGEQPRSPAERAFTIGIASDADLGEVEPAVADAYRGMIDLLRAGGHHIVTVDLAQVNALDDACGFPIALYQTHETLRATAPDLSGKPFEHLRAAVASPDVAHLLGLAADGAVSAAQYAQAIGQNWPALRNAYAAIFAGIDLILLPTAPLVAPAIDTGAELLLNGASAPTFPTITRYTRPDSMAGLPSISLPFGKDGQGMPIGMMFTAARHADGTLLAFARALLNEHSYPVIQFLPDVSYP
ncbi:amidase [Sphingomonas sp. Root50]|nr:amidase [Sphingomonas sp. Root1294]KQY72359.1 amidase [Sphingomonas sp. Root50]KRB95500.1 amidase [Sphingomonas sp. Root720]